MRQAKLVDKIKYVKKVLKTPYHFFMMSPDKTRRLYFEDKNGTTYSFSGSSMYNAVCEAENYVVAEIKAGTFKEPEMENTDKTQKQKVEKK